VHRQCCEAVRRNSAGTEPLSTGLEQLEENSEAGVGHQRALTWDDDDDDDDDEDNWFHWQIWSIPAAADQR